MSTFEKVVRSILVESGVQFE